MSVLAVGFILEIRSFRRKSAIWLGLVNEQALGLKLALIGFVLFEPESGFIFIILCYKIRYVHFGFSEIGFELGLFFRTAKSSFFL